MADTYKQKNAGYVTASKLKTFIKSPEAYFVEYIKEVDIPRTESKAFLIGTAFDDYFSYGPIEFYKKYFCDCGDKISDLVAKCTEKQIHLTGKEKKDDLMALCYGDIASKVRLTEGETETVLGLVNEAKRQSMFDTSGVYQNQLEVIAEFKGLKLKGTLDRVCLEKQLIRDYKTTSNLGGFGYELASKYGYDLSMAFYYALVKIEHGIECDVLLDTIQSTKPFPSDIFGYRKEKLNLILDGMIIPALNRLLAINQLWEETQDEDIWKVDAIDRHELFYMDSYPYLEGAQIKEITFI